jgi:hypothetical protein
MIAPPKRTSQDEDEDELELLIKEARERQLRRRLLGAASVAIAAAIGLTIFALTIGGAVDNPAQSSEAAGRAAAPLCRSSQLTMSIGGQGATQMVLGGARITNVGGRACVLPSRRPAVRLTWGGKLMHVRQPVPRPGEVQSGAPAHILAPGAKTLISMRWGNWCGARPSGLPTFELLFGRGLALTATGLGVPPCIGPGMPGFLDVSRPLVAS